MCTRGDLLCPADDSEGCGDGEEAEERPEENQSSSGWCTAPAGPHEEQHAEQEGDRSVKKSSMLLCWRYFHLLLLLEQ